MQNLKDKKNILVSIVIPTLNEEKYIQKSLNNIQNNGFDLSKIEVIIVDGGSSDKTKVIIESNRKRLNIKYIEKKGYSVYKALNIGLEHSIGKYFVRVDARSLIPKNYISKCLKHLQNEKIKCAGGLQIQFGENSKSKLIADITNSFIGTGGAKFRTAKKSGYVDSVYLGVYPSLFLKNIGGFEDGSKYVSEDSFINYKIREKGYKVFLDATLKVKYPAKRTFKDLSKQYLIYGAARCFIFKKYKILTSFRQLIPLLFIVAILSLFALNFINNFFGFLLIILISFHFLFVFVFNYSTTQPIKTTIFKIIASLIIHYSHPIGFIIFLFLPDTFNKLKKKID